MKIEIKKLNDKALLPTYGTAYAAGADLCSLEDKTLSTGERHLFKTGLAMAIPSGVYGRIAPRSGLAYKQGIDILAGVIDEDYRGEIGVILINHGNDPVTVKSGDRIAQIIFEQYKRAEFSVVDTVNQTARGDGGYGSTDKPRSVSTEFVLKDRTTVGKFFAGQNPAKIEMAKAYYANFQGDIYVYEENGMRGLCVIDASGEVLTKNPIEKVN